MPAARKILSLNKIAYWLFLAYWAMKPYYLFSSGGLQIADFIMVLSFVVLLFDLKKLTIRKTDLLFIGFIAAGIIINTIYTVVHKNTSFIMSSFYYIFNFMAMLLFLNFTQDKQFLHTLKNVSAFNIFLQLAVWATGLGRTYGSLRYKGTFNDPNQFAFFILMMLFFIYLIEKNEQAEDITPKKRYLFVITYFISLVLIILSASTGMILGIAIFTCFFLFYEAKNKSILLWVLFIFTLVFLLLMFFIMRSRQGIEFLFKLTGGNIYLTRIVNKILSFMAEDNGTLFVADRNITTMLANPKYCLFGAGEGHWHRFYINGKMAMGEIHSTPIALLFSYGILPFSVLVAWAWQNIKGCPKYAYSVLIALLVESFTLVNHRQSLFWILIILVGLCQKPKEKELT